MSTILPHLNEQQSVIVIASMAATARVIAQAYRAELGRERAGEYADFAARLIRDTRNAVFEGLPMREETAIVEAAEHLIAEAFAA